MPGYRILVIEERPKERIAYTRLFESLGFFVDAVPDGIEATDLLFRNKPAMILAAMETPNVNAEELLEQIENSDLDSQVVFLSSEPVVEDAVRLMKLGAKDYFVLPVDDIQLAHCAKSALSPKPGAASGPAKGTVLSPVKIITRDNEMERLMNLATRVADSTAAVLIQGESGTGKELFARFIHENSSRKENPFVAINCAALPENLLESELFGHEKGAFTGAIANKLGKFELAHTGTLFLDEVTEMQIHLQAKLLRVLQEKKVDRVGGDQPVSVDVRIIATTNQDVDQAIEKGNFRQDLYYRLNTIPLKIPPLRDRMKDLEALCSYFVKKYSKIDKRDVKGLTKEAMTSLKSHLFSGNVRELENIIHRAVLLAESSHIKPGDLLLEHIDAPSASSAVTVSEDPLPAQVSTAAPQSLKEMEQQMIYTTLDKTEGNRTHAAKILGISVRTLRNKLNEYKELSSE